MNEIMAVTVSDPDETQEMPVVKGVCVDCGKEIVKEQGDIGTGYGTDPDTGAWVCYDCCAYRDKGEMILQGKASLYLSYGSKEHEERVERNGFGASSILKERSIYVTNWPGTLKIKVLNVKRGRHNIARVRWDVWFVGADGFVWHGFKVGNMTDIVHCKRTKARF